MEILVVAERLFSSKGFHETTMRDIAKAAEFGIGTVYKFFESKEKLHLTIIGNKFSGFHERLKREISEKLSTLEKIKAFIRIWLEFFEENRDFFRVFISEVEERRFGGMGRKLREGIFKKHKEMTEFMIRIFQNGVEEGSFKKYDAELLANAIGGITKSFIANKLVNGKPIKPPEDTETIFQIFAYGVLKDKTQPKSRG